MKCATFFNATTRFNSLYISAHACVFSTVENGLTSDEHSKSLSLCASDRNDNANKWCTICIFPMIMSVDDHFRQQRHCVNPLCCLFFKMLFSIFVDTNFLRASIVSFWGPNFFSNRSNWVSGMPLRYALVLNQGRESHHADSPE